MSLQCLFLGHLELVLKIGHLVASAQIFNHYLPLSLNELNGLFFLCLQDPSVTQHSSNTGYATLDLYNPFDNNTPEVNMPALTGGEVAELHS